MKRCFFSILLLLFFHSSTTAAERPTAITYEFSGGRLGDNLVAYLHAKWISYQYQVPLLIRPFRYAEEFVFFEQEEKLTEEIKSQFNKTCSLDIKNPLLLKSEKSTLFYFPFYIDGLDVKGDVNYKHVEPNWNDPRFKAIIRQSLSFVNPPKGFPLPKDRITVAIHVRKGCGPDTCNMHLSDPLKFPPNSFYIEQIIRLYHLLNQRPLYVHIFSDISRPQTLINEFAKATKGMKIEYHTRDQQLYFNTMMEDFYMMSQFDCIIRPNSSFSIVAAKISNCNIEIFPTHASLNGNNPKIERVETLYH